MPKLNEFQKAAALSYDGGHYSHIKSSEQAEEEIEECHDDTLFIFVLRELGGPMDKSEAIRRLNTAIEQLGEVVLALEMA